MTEPQVWTLIGVFSATMIGVFTFLSMSVTRSIDAVGKIVASLGRELGARIDSLQDQTNTRFESVDIQMAAMRDDVRATKAEVLALRQETDRKFAIIDTKFERVDKKFDRVYEEIAHLNRDVQAIARHVHPD